MFIISVAVTTCGLVVEKQIAIAFARKELVGSRFLGALRPVYIAVLTSKPFNPAATETDVSGHKALKALATTQAKVAASLQIGAFVDGLSNALSDLGSNSPAGDSSTAVDALAKMQQVAARAGDSSNLALDTDLDTYYVQNIVVDQLPKLLGRLGELQVLAGLASATVNFSSENKARFLVLDALIKSSSDEIKHELLAAYRGSPDDKLKQAVEPTYADLFSAVDAYLAGRRASFLDGGAMQTNSPERQQNWETAVESANRTWAVSQVQLDRLLQSRIDRLVTRMDLSLLITGVLVGLSILIAITTYRQIVQPLQRLENVATTVRETKNYDVRVDDASTNEIGRVASAFDRMLAELAAARDRERLEQSELARVTRLTTMGVMTASIAHEINQPLTAIASSGAAAQRSLANAAPNLADVRSALKIIVENAHRASQIIASVRAMFKKEGHEKDWIDVNELVFDVLALIQNRIQREAITVRTDLRRDIPSVLAGRTQLQQVVMNLMANAIDAMKTVTDREKLIAIKSDVDEPGNILISVKDTGAGIDPENLDRVFDAFFTTKSEGMGMGLSICRSIIEGYGGRLWAAHGESCGSIFFITLPTAEASERVPAAPRAAVPEEHHSA
jgi:signal transduction histidine kinase